MEAFTSQEKIEQTTSPWKEDLTENLNKNNFSRISLLDLRKGSFFYDLSSLSLEELKDLSPDKIEEIFGPIDRSSFSGNGRNTEEKYVLVKYGPFEIKARYGAIDFVHTEKMLEPYGGGKKFPRSTSMIYWPNTDESDYSITDSTPKKQDGTEIHEWFLKKIQEQTKEVTETPKKNLAENIKLEETTSLKEDLTKNSIEKGWEIYINPKPYFDNLANKDTKENDDYSAMLWYIQQTFPEDREFTPDALREYLKEMGYQRETGLSWKNFDNLIQKLNISQNASQDLKDILQQSQMHQIRGDDRQKREKLISEEKKIQILNDMAKSNEKKHRDIYPTLLKIDKNLVTELPSPYKEIFDVFVTLETKRYRESSYYKDRRTLKILIKSKKYNEETTNFVEQLVDEGYFDEILEHMAQDEKVKNDGDN